MPQESNSCEISCLCVVELDFLKIQLHNGIFITPQFKSFDINNYSPILTHSERKRMNGKF